MTAGSGKPPPAVPPRPRSSGGSAKPSDPRLFTPVHEPLFDEASIVDKTDRQPPPPFDEVTDDTTAVRGIDEALDDLGKAREDDEATAAAYRGAKRREEPGPMEAPQNRWSTTVMGQGPPPPTAEEIAAALKAEEDAAAKAKKDDPSAPSDAPSTKKRTKFFDPIEEPRRMGRYELIAEIASGGMATVFLARLRGAGGFSRLVAIKRLHPHLQNEEDFIQMFLDEARIAAHIHHAHVVPILEIGSSEADGYYLVMEYIEGITLYDIAAGAAREKIIIPREVTLRIVLDTLSGLHAAHELRDADGTHLSVVHRDCTPSNMLVGLDGSTRLTDFGVARAESRLSQTLGGALKGKVAYMAPEQVRREDYDRRADVFSMGVILWELLTQKRLFRAETKSETLNRVMTKPIPRVGEVAYGIPTSLEVATAKALARDTGARFQTAIDMAEALEKAVGMTVASPRQVAEFVTKLFGRALAERRELIRKWTDATDGGVKAPSLPPPRLSDRPPKAPSMPPPKPSEATAIARKLTPSEEDALKQRSPPPPREVPPAPPSVPGEAIVASPIIAIDPHPASEAVEHRVVSIEDPLTPGARRITPKLPDHKVSLSPAVVASLSEKTPASDPASAQAGMRSLELYAANEPTVLKARPKAATYEEPPISLPTRSLGGYFFVAIVAVGVAALLLFGWTRWQAHETTAPAATSAPK